MNGIDITSWTELDLLRFHGMIVDELCDRRVCRSKNNPLADYTEWLVSRRLGLTLAGNSKAGFDAVSSSGIRYQIKGRRLSSSNGSTQLSAIRNLESAEFHFLIGVMFRQDYSIDYALSIPHAVVLAQATYQQHTNSYRLFLRRNIAYEDGVQDLTDQLTKETIPR